ncbi:MAG: hypothetical protein ACI9UN_002194 [Granulosicoccus sp.]|jgi:hypothetical protein
MAARSDHKGGYLSKPLVFVFATMLALWSTPLARGASTQFRQRCMSWVIVEPAHEMNCSLK